MIEKSCFFLPEDEDIEHRQVERQTQSKLSSDQPGDGFICDWIGCFAVVNFCICSHVLLADGSHTMSTAVGEVAVKAVVLLNTVPQQ